MANGSVFDDFNIDIVIYVLYRSLFSPFFAIWVPIITFSQGHGYPSNELIFTTLYFVLCFVFWFFKYIDSVWRNKSWQRGLSGLLGFEKLNWDDEIVVITGGSSGIGLCLAETLAIKNVCVVVLDQIPLETQFDIEFYQCDISDWEQVSKVAERIRQDIGHPTIIVNNAGVVTGKPLLELSPIEIKRTFEVNSMGSFWTVKQFLPQIIEKNHGHVVTISSVLGDLGSAQLADYSASKAALRSFHSTLENELKYVYKKTGVRTSLVVAGQVQTSMFSTVKISGLVRFFCPQVSPNTIAKAVTSALDTNQSQDIYLPFYTNFNWTMYCFPNWLKSLIQWIAGSNIAMESFAKKDE